MSTKRRPTIGENPLDALLAPPRPAPEKAAPKPPKAPRKAEKATEPPPPSRIVKATYNVPVDLVEEARNAVLALMGPPVRLTLASLVESALRRELDRLRKTHHNGAPFEGPGRALRGGRPLK